MKVNKPDRATAKLILAETVDALEKLHKANISFFDVHYENILIDSKGHLLLSDFMFSKQLTSNKDSSYDWRKLKSGNDFLFPKKDRDENVHSLNKLLRKMTDDRILGNNIL